MVCRNICLVHLCEGYLDTSQHTFPIYFLDYMCTESDGDDGFWREGGRKNPYSLPRGRVSPFISRRVFLLSRMSNYSNFFYKKGGYRTSTLCSGRHYIVRYLAGGAF